MEIDQNFKVKDPLPPHLMEPLLKDRKGVFQYQPAYFTGDGTAEDARVGVLWYAQPYLGLRSAAKPPDDQTFRTIVEGAIGYGAGLQFNAGASYGPVGNITVPNGEGPIPDPIVGQYFLPCPDPKSSDDNYFGEYIGGAFLFASSTDVSALAAWTDSRQGCISQLINRPFHQHVYTGGP